MADSQINPQVRLRYAVVDAYRNQLEKRYSVTNIHALPGLSGYSEERINEIRGFFLSKLYPEADKRQALDNAFERLGSVLRSPGKLMPLLGTAVKSVWKFGTMIPAALSGGLRTVEAYLEIRRLENRMVEHATGGSLQPEQLNDEKIFAGIIGEISDKEINRFRRDLKKLFQSLANIRLLETTVGVMQNAMDIMSARPQTYSAEELAGIQVGFELLTGGLDLFKKLDPPEIELLVTTVETIEMNWISQMKGIAGKPFDPET